MIRDISYIDEGLIPAPNDGPALRYNPLREEDVTDIAVHHMTGEGPAANATTGQEIGFLQGIDRFHRTTRGLDGIGYHIVPMASGRVYVVSRLDKFGAHVGGENDHLIGLALPGDYSTTLPSPKHLEACHEAVRFVYEYLDREVPTTPHLNWGGTTCPGDRWAEWVPQLTQIEEEDMALIPGVIIIAGDEHYFCANGVRVHLPNPWGFIHMGVPTMQVGEEGAPADAAELYAIPSLEEMIGEYSQGEHEDKGPHSHSIPEGRTGEG